VHVVNVWSAFSLAQSRSYFGCINSTKCFLEMPDPLLPPIPHGGFFFSFYT
jgi:hypothetical protein